MTKWRRSSAEVASRESANRVWFTLAEKTYAPANLQSAFDKMWRKGGSARERTNKPEFLVTFSRKAWNGMDSGDHGA